MKHADAAALWDELEKKLVRIGLPEDGRLLRLRAELIRTIAGDNDAESRHLDKRPKRQSVGTRDADLARLLDPQGRVGPADGPRRETPRRTSAPVLGRGRAASQKAFAAEAIRRFSSEIYDERWAAMIEQACSGKKMGYSGDDEVEYEQR